MVLKLLCYTEGGTYVEIFWDQDMRKTSGTIREEVIENWVKLQNVERYGLNLLIKDNKMGGAWSTHGEEKFIKIFGVES